MSDCRTVTEMLDEVANEICSKYCRFPEISRGEVEDLDLADDHLYDTYCTKCPLNKL